MGVLYSTTFIPQGPQAYLHAHAPHTHTHKFSHTQTASVNTNTQMNIFAPTYAHANANMLPPCASIHTSNNMHTNTPHPCVDVYLLSNISTYTHKPVHTLTPEMPNVPGVDSTLIYTQTSPRRRPTDGIHVHSCKPRDKRGTPPHLPHPRRTHRGCTRERPGLGCLPLIIPQS